MFSPAMGTDHTPAGASALLNSELTPCRRVRLGTCGPGDRAACRPAARQRPPRLAAQLLSPQAATTTPRGGSDTAPSAGHAHTQRRATRTTAPPDRADAWNASTADPSNPGGPTSPGPSRVAQHRCRGRRRWGLLVPRRGRGRGRRRPPAIPRPSPPDHRIAAHGARLLSHGHQHPTFSMAPRKSPNPGRATVTRTVRFCVHPAFSAVPYRRPADPVPGSPAPVWDVEARLVQSSSLSWSCWPRSSSKCVV